MVIVPEAMKLRETKGAKAEMSFINFFLYSYCGLGFLIVLTIFFIGSVESFSVISKFSLEVIKGNDSMILFSLLVLPLMLVTNFLTSILTSHKFFTVPMVVSLVNSVLTTVLLLVFHNKLNIISAMLALLGGYLLNLCWLLYIMYKKLSWKFFIPISIPTKQNMHDLGLMIINILPVSLRSYLIIFFLSGLGAGIITAVNYGQQIASIPEVFIVGQIVSVTGIKMSELTAQGKLDDLGNLFNNVFKILFFILTPIAFLLMINSLDVVNVLFMQNNLEEVVKSNIALVLLFIASILPIKALDAMVTKLVTSQQKIKAGFWYGTLMHILITTLVFTGIYFWGLKGFLAFTVISYVLIIPVVFYFLIKKVAPFIHFKSIILSGLKIIWFNAVIASIVFLIDKFLLEGMIPLASIIISSLIYFVLLFFANRIFAINRQLEAYVIAAVRKTI